MTFHLIFFLSNLNNIGKKSFCLFHFCVKSPYLGLNRSILVPTTLGNPFFFHFGFIKLIDLVYLTEESYV